MDNNYDYQVEFPNGVEYILVTGNDIFIEKGIEFPMSFKNKNLAITGTSCSGKSSLERLLGYGGYRAGCENFLYMADPNNDYCIRDDYQILYHLSQEGLRVAEMHMEFYLWSTQSGEIAKLPHAPHSWLVYEECDYEDLTITDLSKLKVPQDVIENVLFEFRLFEPKTLLELSRKRHEYEINRIGPRHIFDPTMTAGDYEKGLYLLWQAAHQLFIMGADVYVRNNFDGSPLRFLA